MRLTISLMREPSAHADGSRGLSFDAELVSIMSRRTFWPSRWIRPSSRASARDASETSLFLRDPRPVAGRGKPVKPSSSESRDRADVSIEAGVVRGLAPILIGAEAKGPKLADDSREDGSEAVDSSIADGVDAGERRVSGYSSSKRSIIPRRVSSRKDSRPARISSRQVSMSNVDSL